MVSSDFWLSHLTTMPWKYQHDVTSLSVYGCLVCVAVLVVVIRAYLFFHSSLRSSERLHDKMVTCLLQAPVLFFDTTPAGRILNRFSKDIGCIDEILPKTFLSAIQYLLFVGSAALVPSITNFWLCFVSLPIFLAFVFVTRYYLKTSRDLKRLESICRSPVFSHFSETMDGLDTIRTRKAEEQFIEQFYRLARALFLSNDITIRYEKDIFYVQLCTVPLSKARYGTKLIIIMMMMMIMMMTTMTLTIMINDDDDSEGLTGAVTVVVVVVIGLMVVMIMMMRRRVRR